MLEMVAGQLEAAGSLSDLQKIVVGLRDSLGIDHIVYHWVSADGEQYGCGTYDPVWVQRYVDREYLRIDPVILACFKRYHPVDWRRLDWSSRVAKAFRQDALEHGVGNQGYSVPIHGPSGQFALLTLSHMAGDEEWDTFVGLHQREIILVAHYLNTKALEIASSRAPKLSKPLSPREVDALTYLAMGYSRGQVAEMLAISEHTLRAYIESARLKLNAQNTVSAVAQALLNGHIVIGGADRAAPGDWPGKERTAMAS
jgi:DNA-binding CsgD family transcriptional regulator